MKQAVSRQNWMATFAKAPLAHLEQHVDSVLESALFSGQKRPKYQFLRSPEIGLAMIRGRAGGTGQPFNLGEMTITRCVVQLKAEGKGQKAESKIPNPISGFGYVAGRSHRHAELVALCDALMQHPDWCDRVQAGVIEPLVVLAQEKRAAEAAEVESTRVNFFTMLRGES
ncbi:MAG: phosphonate C-P lyase system protein PhnG [Cyanobacteria bacterium P01_F01_bin.150]